MRDEKPMMIMRTVTAGKTGFFVGEGGCVE
jgi:hypothetical protein